MSIGGTTIRRYAKKIADECGIDISKTRKGPVSEGKQKVQKITSETVMIKKQDIIKLLWTNKKNSSMEVKDIYSQYPIIHKLKV